MLHRETGTANELSAQPRKGADLTRLLRDVRHELRQQNVILSAKAEVIEVFKAALLGPPRNVGMSPDILWALEREIERRKKNE